MIRRFVWACSALALVALIVPASAQDASELLVRTNRLEGQVRQLSGQIEQLQFQNKRLEEQLKKFQEDVEFRFQERGGRPAASGATPPAAAPGQPKPQKRGDAFDPSAQPAAPGSPRSLGDVATASPAAPQGQPGRRIADLIEDDPGGPMDLNQMSRSAGLPQGAVPSATPSTPHSPPQAYPQGMNPAFSQGSPAGTPRAAVPGQTGSTVASVGTGVARDEYDLAYGLVLQRQYEQAEMAFKQFLQAHPKDRMAANATYWLGETYFRRAQYPDAVEQYLKVYRTYNSSKVAPDSMLKLGLALRGMGQPDQACATLAEVSRRYPEASAEVRASAERELKRGSCAP
jgi:tol-pal system protein YbgF